MPHYLNKEMDIFYTLYIIATCSLATLYLVLTIEFVHRRRAIKTLRNNYIKVITQRMLTDDATQPIITKSPFERMALAEAIYSINGHCYGSNREFLQQTVEANHLDKYIIGRLSHASNSDVATSLLHLGAISPNDKHKKLLTKYLHDKDHTTSLCAMLSLLNSSPKAFISHLHSPQTELQPFDLACIITQLRCGAMPIAFEPLLCSNHRNLKLLGLSIVRGFELEIAAKHITRIISQDEEVDTIHEALYTLAALKRPLNSHTIRHRLQQMPTPYRIAFCRHLTVEGYSLQSIERLFPHKESSYAEHIITTYKRELIKTNA